MVIKGSRRAGSLRDAQALLNHLLRGMGNERVHEITGPGAVADLINDARAFATGGRNHAVWHLSISPEVEMSEPQWARARALLLEAYKTRPDLPTASVRHSKPHRQALRGKRSPRPAHEHMVFGTTDPATGRQIDPFMHYLIHERVARQLEFEFGHPLVRGKHNTAVHRWFLANGKPEIAQAMEAAGFLDEPAVSKVSDRERSVAIREGRDPFLAMDASAAALAVVGRAPPATRGQAIRQHYADEGFVLARGDGRLVLVSVDGRGKPVGVSKKTGLKEAALRELLGTEYDRLPHLPKGADIAAWLQDLAAAALAPQTPHPPDEVSNHAAHEAHHSLQHRPASGYSGRGGSRRAPVNRPQGPDGNRIRRNPRRDHDRPGAQRAPGAQEANRARGEPDRAADPAGRDPRDRDPVSESRSSGQLDRPRPDSGRRPTRFEQARLTRITEQHLSQHRATIAGLLDQVRQPPDPARVEHMAGQIIAARRRAAQALRVPEPEPSVRGIELAEAEHGSTMLDVRKRIWILMAIRRRYDTGWLPIAVVQHITGYQYDRQAEEVVLTLDNGARIRDGMSRIRLEGQIDEVSVGEMVAAVQRRGWGAVNLTGSLEFQRAAALRLAMLEPPVSVVGSQLNCDDIKQIEEIAGRACLTVPIDQEPDPAGIRL